MGKVAEKEKKMNLSDRPKTVGFRQSLVPGLP